MNKKTLIVTALLLALSPVMLMAESAVVYFSATGNTGRVANVIAQATGSDVFEIVPEDPYSNEDLRWTNPESRVVTEHEDPSLRPALANDIDLSDYDTVFIGYPLWWGQAPHVVYTFMESTDLDGKTVIPFCTSQSSPIGSSAENLREASGDDANWLEGRRFRSRVSDADVIEWVNGLPLE